MGRVFLWIAILWAICPRDCAAWQVDERTRPDEAARSKPTAESPSRVPKGDRPPAGKAKEGQSGASKSQSVRAGESPGTGPSRSVLDWNGDPVPNDAMARIGTARLRCQSTRAFAFSEPAEDLLANIDDWGRVRVWETKSGKLRREFFCPEMLNAETKVQVKGVGKYTDPPRISFSADRSEIVVATQITNDGVFARRLSLITGKHLDRVRLIDADRHYLSAWRVTWDGRAYVLKHGEGHVTRFDIAGRMLSDKSPEESTQERGDLHWHTFSSCRARVVPAAAPDQSILEIQPRNERIVRYPWRYEPIHWLCTSPSGKRLFIFGGDPTNDEPYSLLVFDAVKGKLLFEHRSVNDNADFSPRIEDGPRRFEIGRMLDERYMLGMTTSGLGFTKRLCLFDTEVGRIAPDVLIPRWTTREVVHLSSTRIYGLTNGHTFRVWDIPSSKELAVVGSAHQSAISNSLFSPDGKSIASVDDAGFLRVSRAADGKPIWGVEVGVSKGLRYSPTGDQLINYGKHALRVFDSATGKVRFSLAKNSADHTTSDAAISLNGKTLLQAAWGNSIHHWDLASGKLARTVELPGVEAVWPDEIGADLSEPPSLYLPDKDAIGLEKSGSFFDTNATGIQVLARTGRDWTRFDVDTGKSIKDAPDRALSEHASKDGAAKSSSRPLATILHSDLLRQRIGPAKQIADVDGRVVLEPNAKHEVQGFDRLQRQYVKVFDISSASSSALKLSPDGRILAQADADAPTLRLYRVATGKVVKRWAGLPATVTCLAFSPDGKRLAAGFRDSQILVWDLESLGLSK